MEILKILIMKQAALVAQTVVSAYNAGDPGLIPGLGRSSRGGHGNPLQYSCLENPHGQKSLAGYGPSGCKELDTTEQHSDQETSRNLSESYP